MRFRGPHAYSGSAFRTEPAEWFGGKRHVLKFRHSHSHIVLHVPSRSCPHGFEHLTETCGYFAANPQIDYAEGATWQRVEEK